MFAVFLVSLFAFAVTASLFVTHALSIYSIAYGLNTTLMLVTAVISFGFGLKLAQRRKDKKWADQYDTVLDAV